MKNALILMYTQQLRNAFFMITIQTDNLVVETCPIWKTVVGPDSNLTYELIRSVVKCAQYRMLHCMTLMSCLRLDRNVYSQIRLLCILRDLIFMFIIIYMPKKWIWIQCECLLMISYIKCEIRSETNCALFFAISIWYWNAYSYTKLFIYGLIPSLLLGT